MLPLPHCRSVKSYWFLNGLFHYHVCCTISNMFLLLEMIAKFYTNRRSNGNLISTTLRQMLNRNKVQKLLAFCKVIRDENIDSTKTFPTYINRSLQIRNSDRKILKTEHDELNYQWLKVYATYIVLSLLWKRHFAIEINSWVMIINIEWVLIIMLSVLKIYYHNKTLITQIVNSYFIVYDT